MTIHEHITKKMIFVNRKYVLDKNSDDSVKDCDFIHQGNSSSLNEDDLLNY